MIWVRVGVDLGGDFCDFGDLVWIWGGDFCDFGDSGRQSTGPKS